MPNPNDTSPQPDQLPSIPTPAYGKAASDAWIAEGLMQIQRSLGGLEIEVKRLASASDKHDDKLNKISRTIYAAGVVLAILGTVLAWILNKGVDVLLTLIKH